MTENQRQFRIGQFPIDHVKVSAANRAGADAHEQLSFAWLRLRHIAQFQDLFRFVENHCTHDQIIFILLLSLLFQPPKLTSKQEHEEEKLARAGRDGSHLPLARACRMFTFVLVIVGAAEERHLVEHVLLEPFEPEINYWCNE